MKDCTIQTRMTPGRTPMKIKWNKDISLSPEIITALAVLLYFIYSNLEHPIQPDLYYMIRCGEEFWRTKGALEPYPFSWVPSECRVPWINYQWLAHLIAWFLYSAWGLFAMVILKSVLYGAGYTVMFFHARKTAGTLAALLSLIPAIWIGKTFFMERPMAYTSLFFPLLAYLLLDIERSSLRIFHWIAFPAIFAVWVNVHGGFFPGLIFLLPAFIYLAVRNFSRLRGASGKFNTMASLTGIWLLCLLATLFLTPYGTKLFHCALEFLFLRPVFINVAGDMISPLKTPGIFIPFLLISSVTTVFLVISLIKKSHQFSILELSIYFFWLLFALRAQRNIQLYSSAAVPVMAFLIHGLLENISLQLSKSSFTVRLRSLAEATKLIALFIVISLYLSLGFSVDLTGKSYEKRILPVHLKDFLLANRLPSKLYCYDVLGDYFMFYLYPKYTVSFDSGWNINYSDQYFIEISHSFAGRDAFFSFINKYGLDTIILCTKPSFLDGVPGWLLIYEGEGCRVFLRVSPANREIVEKFRKDQLIYPDSYQVNSFLYERYIALNNLHTARKYLIRLIIENPEEKVLRDNLHAIDRALTTQ